ncbi:MAG: hypothetical protein ACFE9N_10745 [Promethearchaeota archaeon]
MKIPVIKKIQCLITLVILLVLIFNFFLMTQLNFKTIENQKELFQISTSNPSEQWLRNINFTTQEAWFYTKGNTGDNSTVNAFISNQQANYRIIGDSREFSNISGTPNSSTSIGWYKSQNENLQYPEFAKINASGCYVYHYWDEVEFSGANQTKNYPAVHFRNNITMDVDMSDYIITSASLDVIFNATVGPNIDTPRDDYTGSQDEDLFAIGDFVTFYALISDKDFTKPYVVGYNKTKYLGQYGNGNPSILNITDSLLNTVNEQDLIRALTAAFEKDPEHSNFIITLGIDIFSEDNDNSGDHDDWEALIIKECNLTFSYERRIEKFTTISWNQVGNSISGANIQIIDASFNFKCKIDELWPSTLSPFSEIRLLINDNPYKETLQLSSLTTSFQAAKSGGYDVTYLILKDTNISVSIQLFIADTFGLDNNLTISIDDVSFYITYIRITAGMDFMPLIIALSAAVAVLIIGFTLYQTHFKYPHTVRKVRKLRKKIKKGKKLKSLILNTRKELINNYFQDNIQTLSLDVEKKIE